jgi:nucleoside-diphosphate-sugar epimerase
MAQALIGHTGFVGGNINAQASFDDTYNTSNITDIDGKEYDLVVSAATYAEMWKINQDPEGDLAQINGLIDHLKTVKAKKFVLISTVGVYKSPNGADEDTPIETDGLTPYGTNRYHLEQFVSEHFDALIVRLPGLFGEGLKKNVIYDLLNNNMVEKIHAKGVYQYYNLANIWKDINVALDTGLKLINFATEPVSTADVAAYAFDMPDFNQEPEGVNPAFWDMHSKHAELYGGTPPYIYDKRQVLEDIKAFVAAQRAQTQGGEA